MMYRQKKRILKSKTVKSLIIFLSFSVYAAQKIPDVRIKAEFKKIESSGETQVTQLLKNKAGLETRDSTGNGANFEASLRGFGSNAGANTLILVDGIRQNGYDLMPPRLGHLAPLDIESIDVLPQSLGTLFGEQAVGGIISITTKNPSKRTFDFQSYAGGPNWAEGIGFTNGNKLYRFRLNQDSSLGYRNRNAQKKISGQVTLNSSIKTYPIRLNYQGAHEMIELPGALTERQVRQNRRQAVQYQDISHTWSHHLSLTYRNLISDNLGIELIAGVRHQTMQGFLSNITLNQVRTLYFLEPKILCNWLTIGFLGESFWYTLKSFDTIKADQKTYSPYIRATLPFTSKLDLIVGTRMMNNAFLAKEIGLEYQWKPQWKTYLRRDENFRLPKIDEQTWIVSGIHSLKPQRGVSYETGIKTTNPVFSGNCSLYRLALRNEIDFDPTVRTESGFKGANRNLDATLRQGALCEIQAPLSVNTELNGHYAWTSAVFNKGPLAGNEIPFVSRHRGGLELGYRITPNIRLQMEYTYTGPKLVMGDYENQAPRLPGFGLLHATVSYDTSPWHFSIHVHNLTNTLYNEVAFLQDQFSHQKERFFYPAAERFWTLQLVYR